MPKVNTNLQITRVNRRNNTDKNSSNGIKTTSELLLGLKAEHIPLPDTQYIKRILENSRRAKSKKNDPPRPPNAFFLFRNALNSHLATRNLKVPQISMAAGELWGTASEEIKNHYTKLQEIAKVLHLEMHPGYVYRPRKNFPTPNPPIHSSDKNSSEN
ncbi:mating-type m-specific polypeptide mc 2 [Rhizophagus irregularis DAOM 181602=DAOM 197198]|nr:mating-type m-specific polypeptide mc 2 [Rhizophagus irregularis DAOM 181602=DAOM 197198]